MSIDLKKVFDLDRNVFIEACAGAGKTWLLSKRFAVIMDDFARQRTENPQLPVKDASNILVITFTRKAAAEMSGRIYGDLNQLLNDQALDHVPETFGKHLRKASQSSKMHIRSTYSRNAISTIDSFCTQILRDQAENLDIDPEFRIQDEADTQRMELETWESFLRERSRNADENLKILLQHLSVYHISEYIKKLQSHSQLLNEWLDFQVSHTPEELQTDFKASHPLPDNLGQIEQLLVSLVESLPHRNETPNPDHAHYKNFEDLLAFLSNPIEDEYRYGLEIFEFVRRIALTSARDKYLTRIAIPAGVWTPEWKSEISQRLKIFLTAVESLVAYETLIETIPGKSDLEACAVQHHLARFFQDYLETLNQRLKREGVLSFNEVIVQTRKVLKDPEVAAHYGQRFSHILVDEFQDTNDLRWDIVRLIAQGGKASLRSRGLFIVGDTKQSIYRFNQADVQVMNRVRSIVEKGGGWILTADETFRSSQQFVSDVINPLIGSVFPGAEEQDSLELYETVFRPTVAAKSSPLTATEHGISRCILSVVLEDETSAGTSADILHTASLAKEWLEWIAEKKLETDSGPSIGILLRSFTHILDYIRIFTAKGLEFEVLSSKGLFAQQESFDIYHLLSVLVNPLDDLALVGVLRSPFFVLKDSEIQHLREQNADHKGSGWVWNGLNQQYPEIVETLRSWQQVTAREPVDRLINNILATDERRLGWLSETGGSLRLANLDRLILLIHQLSLDSLGLREIQEFFKYQIQHGDASQAELPGATRIQILTIHKAKGLEFPVVILPDLQAPSPSEKSGIYIGREADEWQAGISIDSLTDNYKTWMYERIKAQTKAEEEAEDKRLFYVSVTRARYGIGFVARINPARQPSSNTRWRRYLTPVFDLELEKQRALEDPLSLQQEWKNKSTSNIIYDLILGSDLAGDHAVKIPVINPPLLAPAPVTKPLIYEEISPHTIMTWMDQKTYAGSEERQVGEDLGLETSALTFGRLLHRAMELEWFVPDAFKTEIELFLEDEGVSDEAAQLLFLTDLSECLSIYRASEIATKLEALPDSHKLPELPVFGYLQSESRMYKVSGIIDLLYREGNDWVVLDYKTDQELPALSSLKQHAYWYQIQTYLWILKLLYGIDARGELYFNRFDAVIPIAFDESTYFSSLAKFAHSRALKPVLPSAVEVPRTLAEILKRLKTDEEVILIEPTKNSGERLAQSLARSGLNSPSLKMLTLAEFRKMWDPGGRRLTPYLTRLAVARLLGKRPQWGIVNRLAEAFYKATQGEFVVAKKEPLFEAFKQWCSDHGMMIPGQASVLENLPRGKKIIVNSIHSTAPTDYQFLTMLTQTNDIIFLDPLHHGKARSGFGMSIHDWMTQDEMPPQNGSHSYTPCFSINEEVQLVGNQIRQLLLAGAAPAQILIAVSSMERYVPAIKRVFDQLGISVRLSKREPVMERPVTHLAFALIQGRMARQLSWDMAMSVWLHPLVLPGGGAGYTRLKLDIEMRKLGVTMLDDSLPELMNQPKMKQATEDLLKFIKEGWLAGQAAGLVDSADWLLDLLKAFQFTHRLDGGSVASKSYTSLKNALIGIRNDWKRYLNHKGSLRDLNRELRERLKGVEVASAQQGFGVDVISLLDTLNLQSGHLFVMGLTEGQFPLSPDTNPYLKQSKLNPWYLNLYLFKQWLARPADKLYLTAPLRNADGAPLQESTFCQYLNKLDYPKLPAISLDRQIDQLSGKMLAMPKSRRQERHNQLLAERGAGDWYGKLDAHDLRSFEHISASAFDELIKCPQRYWYGRKLQLEPAETNIVTRQEIEVGNLVHKVLEMFGRAGGFLLAVNDFPNAMTLLEQIANDALREKQVDLDTDLLNNKWGELYFKNFQDPERNLIAALLQAESNILSQFNDRGLHEQSFGDVNDEESWPSFEMESAKLKLSLRGKLDRVFVSEKHVWAADYKTGSIDVGDSRDFWTSQMLFYYIVLKSRFPDKGVVLTYEQLKSFKDGAYGIQGYLGDLSSDNPVLDRLSPKSRAVVPIGVDEDWSVEKIQKETLAFAQPLAENNFPLTSRDENKACAYCLYERICRKTALPR
ncbi:MAG: exodeoxyribonuclease V subunit gamma [Candidatus Marinimicrobia bacterium]|nr:exodeoxyribonuclease V subunit gamma [Candidatus Neomarinimicrobiota bacterium]